MTRRARGTLLTGLGSVGIVLALALIIVANAVSLKRSWGAARRLDHTNEARAALATTQSLLVDAETGQRGFLVTGKPSYLEPYERARAQIGAALDRCERLITGTPTQRKLMDELRPLVAAKLSELKETIAAKRRGDDARALAIVESDRGKMTMDRIRAIFADLDRAEATALVAHTHGEMSGYRFSLLATFAAALMLLIFGALVLRLNRVLRRAIQREQAASTQLERALRGMPFGVMMLKRHKDAPPTLLLQNDRAAEILGSTATPGAPGTWWPRRGADGSAPSAAEDPLTRTALTGESVRGEEVSFLRRDGRTIVVRVHSLLLDELAIVAFDDITAARETARFMEKFIGILGHDLRSPLTSIQMTAELLARQGGLTEPQHTAIERVRRSTGRMIRMVSQLLDMTRARMSGGIPIDRRSVNITELVCDAVSELKLAHPDRAIECIWREDIVGLWDADRLAQLISNLIGNALQHGAADTPVRVSVEGSPDAAVVKVHSEGNPIPKQILPVLFEPFCRGRGTSSTTGLGLGLYIAGQIARGHGGSIEVASSRAEGTTFKTTLPRAQKAA